MTTAHRDQDKDSGSDFPQRLQEVITEFGSRNALSKASGIAISTLQAYEAGSKPGLDALVTLARIGNLSFEWLLTGKGKIRPSGMPSGASLSDVVMVDQYQPGTAISMEVIVGHIPFGRESLEKKLGLTEPTRETLLVIEAEQNLAGIQRGDLVLVDRQQTNLTKDGIYLLNDPGLAFKEISIFPNDCVLMTGSGTEWKPEKSVKQVRASLKMRRSKLLGDGRFRTSKVIGRAVSIANRRLQ
jgi:hypothetical protein